MSFIYFNNQFFHKTEGVIPLTDRGFLFGDGIFSTVYIEDGIPLFLEDQLNKLSEQCAAANIISPEISKNLIFSVIDKNDAYNAPYAMKIIVSGGDTTEKNLNRREGRLAIILQSILPCSYELNLGIFPHPLHLCHSHYKSLANLNRLYVSHYAQKHNYDDAVTCTANHLLLETSFGNIFWTQDRHVFTPNPQTLSLYFGITVKKFLEALENKGYILHFVEQDYRLFPKKASVFRTSSLTGIIPVRRLNETNLKTSLSEIQFFQNLYSQIKDTYKNVSCTYKHPFFSAVT